MGKKRQKTKRRAAAVRRRTVILGIFVAAAALLVIIVINSMLRRTVEKYDPDKVWTAVLYDADQQNYPYLKRFCFEQSAKRQNFLGENKQNVLLLLTSETYPRINVVFGGHDSFREAMIVDAGDFVGVKSFKAKGKRLTTFTVDHIEELEPVVKDEPEEQSEADETVTDDNDAVNEDDGQMKLF